MDATSRNEILGPWPAQARKIRLDSDTYCAHSMRATHGDADCDHDFEVAPSVTEPTFAVWRCTKCSRAFRYEVWGTGSGLS